MHREYLRMFAETLPDGIRQMIRSLKNCEDIALSMVMSNHCQCAAALFVKAKTKVYDIGPDTEEYSLHKRPSHYIDRTRCLNEFGKYFASFPLKTVRANCSGSAS